MPVGAAIELKIRVKSSFERFCDRSYMQNWPIPVDDLGCADKNLILSLFSGREGIRCTGFCGKSKTLQA